LQEIDKELMMQSIKYSVIAVIFISFLLPNVSFAQEKTDDFEEGFLKKLRQRIETPQEDRESITSKDKKSDNELVRLMKYQAEAKNPGMAALLGGTIGFGVGHYYVGGNWSSGVNLYCSGEIGCLIAIGIGAVVKEPVYEEVEDTWKEEKVKVGEETPTGAKLALLGGLVGFAILRLSEPFSAYDTAVEHNKKLLDKYDISLSLSKMDRSFRLTYRF